MLHNNYHKKSKLVLSLDWDAKGFRNTSICLKKGSDLYNIFLDRKYML